MRAARGRADQLTVHEPSATTTSAAAASTRSSRAFGLLALALFGLVSARLLHSDHAPDPVDALFGLGFLVVVGLALRLDRPLVLPAPFGPAAMIALALLASAALSWHPLVSLLSLSAPFCALAAFLAVTALGASGRRAALAAVLTGGALSSLTAAVQRFITWPDAIARHDELGLSARQVATLVDGRPFGLTLSPDLMAALALAGIVAGLALASSRGATARSAWWKAGALAPTLVCALGLVLSRSAGGALAAGVLFAVYFFVVVVRGLRGPAALLALFGALVVPVLLVVGLGRGVPQLLRSAGERLDNWRVGLDVLAHHLWTGVGFGRFAPAYLAERSADTNVTRYAHSFVVQTLVEGGVLFGAALSLVVVGGALLLLRSRLSGRPDRSRDVVLAGVFALLARAAYDYDLQIAATASSFAVLLGVAWVDAQRDGPVLAEGALPATARRRTALASLVLVLLLLVAASGAVIGNWRAAALEPFTLGNVIEPRDVERVRAYAARMTSDPHAAVIEARLLRGALASCRAEQCATAVQHTRTFLDVERAHPPADVAVLAALLAHRLGDEAGVTRALNQALAIDPGSPEAHRLRLRIASETNDPRLPEYQQAAELWKISERER